MIARIQNESNQFNDEYWHCQLNISHMNPAPSEIPDIYAKVKGKIIDEINNEILLAGRL